MSAVPGPVYGLEVPPGEILIPASMDFPASFRITMAAVDPTEDAEPDEEGNVPAVPRSTLRLVKRAIPGLDEDEDDFDEEYMQALLEGGDDDDESDEEANGGPSDPSKSKKQKQAAAIKKLLEATKADDEDEEMEDAKPNGVKSKGKGKGKGKAAQQEEESEEESEDDEEDSDDEDADLENFVICTLDTERHYQQPLDITINHGEKVFFVVTGTHSVHLTGNYIMDEEEDSDDEDEDDYDFDPEALELMGEDMDEDDESDELDDIEDPRITEIEDDEEEAPKLVATKKGKNKRAAEEAENLDDLISKADETKLSKKDKKKLKNNKGEAVAAEEKKDAKADKKVQFAKNLEQGPTGSGKQAGKNSVGVKVVSGVTIDDRTIGTGRTVKSGDNVGVRYIGKLQDGSVFDSNKKGKPFSFKAGKGQVIKGWDIGIVGMAIGGERRLTIPAHLAYGSRGMPGIPANSTLIFDVKLLEIK